MVQTSGRRGDVPIDRRLLAEANDLKLDVTRAAEDGITRAIRAEKERLWRIENAEAIAASNDYLERHGLPLAKYRLFWGLGSGFIGWELTVLWRLIFRRTSSTV